MEKSDVYEKYFGSKQKIPNYSKEKTLEPVVEDKDSEKKITEKEKLARKLELE